MKDSPAVAEAPAATLMPLASSTVYTEPSGCVIVNVTLPCHVTPPTFLPVADIETVSPIWYDDLSNASVSVLSSIRAGEGVGVGVGVASQSQLRHSPPVHSQVSSAVHDSFSDHL